MASPPVADLPQPGENVYMGGDGIITTGRVLNVDIPNPGVVQWEFKANNTTYTGQCNMQPEQRYILVVHVGLCPPRDNTEAVAPEVSSALHVDTNPGDIGR